MENKINLPPFYVGQRVVCVKSHSENIVVSGKEYVVKACVKPRCKCGFWTIDIGITGRHEYLGCRKCNSSYRNETGIWLFDATLFVPIEQTFQSISFEKVIEKEALLIGVN